MKRDLYKGGLRVPWIDRWPKQFPAGIDSRLISGFQDTLPTFFLSRQPSQTGWTTKNATEKRVKPNPQIEASIAILTYFSKSVNRRREDCWFDVGSSFW